MTPERLQQIIQDGESLDVEFKGEERSPLSDNDLVETVVCLANRSADTPAWLLIGVEDDGRITGARPRHESGRTDPVLLVALIANRTRPSLTPRVAVVPLQGKEVIAVEVPPQPAPVVTTSGRYLRRALGGDGRPCCLPMFFHEMHARQADRGAEDYSALLIPDVCDRKPPTSASAGLNRCSRSRWYCNTWKSTDGSAAVKRLNCARSRDRKPTGFLIAWQNKDASSVKVNEGVVSAIEGARNERRKCTPVHAKCARAFIWTVRAFCGCGYQAAVR